MPVHPALAGEHHAKPWNKDALSKTAFLPIIQLGCALLCIVTSQWDWPYLNKSNLRLTPPCDFSCSLWASQLPTCTGEDIALKPLTAQDFQLPGRPSLGKCVELFDRGFDECRSLRQPPGGPRATRRGSLQRISWVFGYPMATLLIRPAAVH